MERKEGIFWRVGEARKSKFVGNCARRGTDQNFAGGKLLDWFDRAPELLQSQILHQAPDDPRVTALTVKYLVDLIGPRREILDDLAAYIAAKAKAKRKPRRRGTQGRSPTTSTPRPPPAR
jgi:hypothetical protein